MADIRNERTERALIDSLLCILGRKRFSDISVSELAAEAHLSRSTFYAHFPNVRAVFDRAVSEFLGQTRTLSTQLKCASCRDAGSGMPFCEMLRTQERYRPLVAQPEFLSSYLSLRTQVSNDRVWDALEDAGLPSEIIEAVIRFQMTGCYAVATTMRGDVDWVRVQATLDTFIRGGLSALCAKG